MKKGQEDELARLGEIYDKKLSPGPFPSRDFRVAGLPPQLDLRLELYIYDIAGIASHGIKLATITAERRAEFRKIVAQNFWDRHPETRERVTAESTPVLFQLMEDMEEARLIVKKYLAS